MLGAGGERLGVIVSYRLVPWNTAFAAIDVVGPVADDVAALFVKWIIDLETATGLAINETMPKNLSFEGLNPDNKAAVTKINYEGGI